MLNQHDVGCDVSEGYPDWEKAVTCHADSSWPLNHFKAIFELK